MRGARPRKAKRTGSGPQRAPPGRQMGYEMGKRWGTGTWTIRAPIPSLNTQREGVARSRD